MKLFCSYTVEKQKTKTAIKILAKINLKIKLFYYFYGLVFFEINIIGNE